MLVIHLMMGNQPVSLTSLGPQFMYRACKACGQDGMGVSQNASQLMPLAMGCETLHAINLGQCVPSMPLRGVLAGKG